MIFSQILSMQQEIANAFIRSFQLTPSEINTLHGHTNREIPITDEFFAVLNKVQVSPLNLIYYKCQATDNVLTLFRQFTTTVES